jgi:transcription antitermination factor NusG
MWHVLHTAPNNEQRVCKVLTIEGLATYLPEYAPPRHTRPGSVRDKRHRWVFPGYVFFETPPHFTRWHVVRWAPGVRSLLQCDGDPAVVDDAIMARLRSGIASMRTTPAAATFRTGQRVIIERGPLAMLDALFEGGLKAPDRVKILVYLLGRQVSVEIDPAILRAAS